MNDLELLSVGRQFAILCTEREQLFRKCQELQGLLDEAQKKIEELTLKTE